MSDDRDEMLLANRANWNARVAPHVHSSSYDLPGLRRGADPLGSFEWHELGELAGADVVHLQCHIGSDTVALARAGARVCGLDFSEESIEAAGRLADDCGVPVDYVRSGVYEAREALEGRSFDLVYTGKGALNWLPDLDRWARVVAGLLRPGGRLCLVEFHPVLCAAADRQPDLGSGLWLDHDGFGGGLLHESAPQTYTGDVLDGPSETFEWTHGLGSVVNAVLGAGLRIDSLTEYGTTPWTPWNNAQHGWWRVPAGAPRTPLVYALRASLPA